MGHCPPTIRVRGVAAVTGHCTVHKVDVGILLQKHQILI